MLQRTDALRMRDSADELDGDEPSGTTRPALSVRQLLHILFRRKWLILGFFVCSVAGGRILHAYLITPVYLATSQILVTAGREHVSDLTLPTGGAVRPWVSFNADEETERTMQLLTGRFLAEKVVRSIGPDALYPPTPPSHWGSLRLAPADDQDDPVRREARAIRHFMRDDSAEPAGRSSMINLSFKHEDAELAARAVNLLADLYLERYLGVHQDPRADAFFETQFQALKRKLRESEDRLLAFKQRNGITNSLTEEQATLRQMQTGLRTELNEARSRKAELDSRFAELHQLMDERGTLYGNLQDDLLRVVAEQKAMRAREEALARRIAELQARLDGLERIRDEYGDLERQIKANEDNHKLYVAKFEEARVAGAMDKERIVSVRVIEQAHPPSAPVDSKLDRILPLVPLFGLIGGVCLAVLLHFVRGTLDTALDVERALGVPVLASISHH